MLKLEDRTTRLDLLDWVIVGGESGREARACRTDWVRALIDQCRQANVACFVKRLGSNSREIGDRIGDTGFVACPSLDLRDRKGGDPFEWPEDMRVREFPKVASNVKEVA